MNTVITFRPAGCSRAHSTSVTCGPTCGTETDWRDVTPIDIAREVEHTRLRKIMELDAQIKRLREKRDDLAGSVRHGMERDGVVRTKTDFCVIELRARKIGNGPAARRRARKHGPYVYVKPTGGDAA